MSHVALSMDAIATAATQLLSWELACTKPELNQLPASGDPRHSQLHGKLQLTYQACQMLCSLNDVDRKQVINELVQICRDPNAPDIARERTRGWRRLLRTRYPFGGYHYLIKFAVIGCGLVVDDRLVAGTQVHFRQLAQANHQPSPLLATNNVKEDAQ